MDDSNNNNEFIELLMNEDIKEFNKIRLKNLTTKPNLSNRDFSSKNLSHAFLNGAICKSTNFSKCTLNKTNFVQAELGQSNFENAILNNCLFMYAEMKKCNLKNTNMKKTNFMWADLEQADLTGSKLYNTIFIESNLQGSILKDLVKDKAYLKFARIKNTEWNEIR